MAQLVEIPRTDIYTAFPKQLLRDRVAIVTGASRGIGRATAIRLAEAGAHVVVNYLQHDREAEEVVSRVRSLGSLGTVVRGDVSERATAKQLVDAAVAEFGRVDVLVANAGIWQGAPIEEMSEELWDSVIDANLRGTWTCCNTVVPQMKRQCDGSIIIVSSTAGQRGEAGYSNYAASKGGQISFAKSLATELAPQIRVNCVAPGWVDTDLNEPVFKKGAKSEIAKSIPLQRIATADDVATSIVFLASPWSRHISGEVVNVNGAAVLCG